MTVTLIVGLCAIVTVWGLISGGGGRLMLLSAVVVGWGVGIAQQLAASGTDLLAHLGDMVTRLGGSL